MSEQDKMIEELSQFGTATIHEALGRIGNLPYEIKPLAKNMKLCGPAYTVSLKPYNNILLHRAYAYAKPGSIIVADCKGGYDGGYWGDLLTLGSIEQGMKGLVIDGCVRDADEIEELGFPVFCRGLSILGTGKDGEGTLNETITIGGIDINPGDIIVGDRDGVVVVPQDRLSEAIELSKEREAKEENVRKELREGKNSLEIYKWGEKYGFETRRT
jgi:4-hydroxy-4-methyl-2-oxoglutarate aldolase